MENNLTVLLRLVETDDGTHIECMQCDWKSDKVHFRSYNGYGRQLVRLAWHTEETHPE